MRAFPQVCPPLCLPPGELVLSVRNAVEPQGHGAENPPALQPCLSRLPLCIFIPPSVLPSVTLVCLEAVWLRELDCVRRVPPAACLSSLAVCHPGPAFPFLLTALSQPADQPAVPFHVFLSVSAHARPRLPARKLSSPEGLR